MWLIKNNDESKLFLHPLPVKGTLLLFFCQLVTETHCKVLTFSSWNGFLWARAPEGIREKRPRRDAARQRQRPRVCRGLFLPVIDTIKLFGPVTDGNFYCYNFLKSDFSCQNSLQFHYSAQVHLPYRCHKSLNKTCAYLLVLTVEAKSIIL